MRQACELAGELAARLAVLRAGVLRAGVLPPSLVLRARDEQDVAKYGQCLHLAAAFRARACWPAAIWPSRVAAIGPDELRSGPKEN